MLSIKPAIELFALAALSGLTGCASTKLETSGSPVANPLCQIGAPAIATAVFWQPRWRPDQKEPALREAAALRGIEDFLGRTGCLAVTGIHRLPDAAPLPSDRELLLLAGTPPAKPERIVIIAVHELGPRLTVGLPFIVEGGTEVRLDVRVLDGRNSESLADTRISWRNSGVLVIKGVKTLDQDMSAALSAALMPGSEVK